MSDDRISLLFERRSIRKFKDIPVNDESIRRIMEAAMAAPSAGNQQPWHFIVIQDRPTLDRIPDIHPYSSMIKEAPLAVLVCADLSLVKHNGMWEQDCSAATQNLLLAVQDLGLGGVWLGVYPREDRIEGLRKLLAVPNNVFPFSLIAIGHPAEEKPPTDRFLPDRIHYDRW
ncbi:MAG TPA: nitroreductase family protein [bacterium]|nr:nitroreductase family protein [bacterium]